MNSAETARLVTELCLAEDRPLGEALRPFAPGPAATAAAGRLPAALEQLGYHRLLVKLGGAWPPALRKASVRLAQLPRPSALRVPLAETCAWFGLIGIVQLVVVEVLTLKVFPVMEKMAFDHRIALADTAEFAMPLLLLALVLLGGLALFGAIGISWLPGWGRHLRQAKEAAATAALLEGGAPPDVFGVWLREAKSLRKLTRAPVGEDLVALSATCAQRTERAMQRFLIFFRYFGFALFGLVAAAVTLNVYEASAALSRLA